MSHQPRNILIFGATGVIGNYITQAILHRKDEFGSIGIFTSEDSARTKRLKIQTLEKQGVGIIVGDLSNRDDVSKAYEGYDTVISCVGRNVIAKQINLLRLAEASETIKRFLPSEYGTDIEYGPQSAHEKPHQDKLKVRAYIRDHMKRLDITYLVTGPYSDLFLSKGFDPSKSGGFDPTSKKAVLLGTGNERISFTSMMDTGKLVVAALQRPDASKNRILKVNSFTASGHDIVNEFERQTGQKWDVEYVSLDQLKIHEKDAEISGQPATGLTLRRIWTEGSTLYDERDNGLLGEPKMETLVDQVQKAISNS